MNFFALDAFGHGSWTYGAISIYDVLALLGVIMFYLIIYKIVNKKPLKFPMNTPVDLEQYTLGFEETHINVKKRSLPMRITVYIISGLIILTPFSELLGSLSCYSIWDWIFW